MRQKGKDNNWPLVVLLGFVFAVPTFVRVELTFGIASGLLVSLVMVAIYSGLVQLFGHGSVIEVWMPFFLILLLMLFLLPAYERVHHIKPKSLFPIRINNLRL